MVSLFFFTKFLTAIVTDLKDSARAQEPCFLYEISKAESFMAFFESDEQVLLD